MNILAVDTSTEFASVALLRDGSVVSDLRDSGKFAHNQRLFDMISEVLSVSGINKNDIDLFAVGVGPGSFTGLRVGVSAVKGMAIGLNKKIIAVSSMDASALKAFGDFSDEKKINIILEGRQKDFFHAEYSFEGGDVRKISEIIVRPYEEYCYINGLTAGNVKQEFIGIADYREGYDPDAVFIGKLAYLRKGSAGYDYGFEPEYYKEFKVRQLS
jgi:tRNA threonylcarbamoyl adenosine modification protein YeaZ